MIADVGSISIFYTDDKSKLSEMLTSIENDKNMKLRNIIIFNSNGSIEERIDILDLRDYLTINIPRRCYVGILFFEFHNIRNVSKFFKTCRTE